MYFLPGRTRVFDSKSSRSEITMNKYINIEPHDYASSEFIDIPREFLLSTYSYNLAPELIAHSPVARRDQSKLLFIDRNTGELDHRSFFELPHLLKDGDVLVINETQVIPAALRGRKATGGSVQILVLDPASVEHPPDDLLASAHRLCLFKASGRIRSGSVIKLNDCVELVFEKSVSPGKALLKFPVTELDFLDFLMKFGSPPLPPYIKQDPSLKENTKRRYQTVYARVPGSIAAPTAGLHFTDQTIFALEKMGVKILRITLHVGPGTFIPIRSRDIRLHKMEPESYCIPDSTAASLYECLKTQRRIIAVGSTCLRALEASYRPDKGFTRGWQTTDLFISPGYKFKVVKGMVTNFHLPESTLLTLVCAFAGVKTILNAYKVAISNNYRFYSYGDSCLIL